MKERRHFISALFGAGVILPHFNSLFTFNGFERLRHAWKSLEVEEMLSAYPNRSTQVSLKIENHRGMLVDESNEKKLLLNRMASHIWDLCDGKHHVEDMVRSITESYDIDRSACRKDVMLTLLTFKRKGVIYV